MTVYEDEIEVRRPSVGTKVLVLACAIMAVLGSFWGIVWFIRAYVEPPRVMAPSPLVLAARETKPAPAPAAAPSLAAETQPADAVSAPPVTEAAQAAPSALVAAPQASDQPSVPNAVADRWAPMNQFAPTSASDPAPSAAPAETAPAALTTPDKETEDVAEGSVPAIQGPAPLPRRKPVMTASRQLTPPLPRPRPDGAVAPQSVWTAVPTTDDRFPQQ